MGHEGMHFSLVSREVIADSVETVMQAERLDGTVLLAGCDKSLPGMLMAAARLDLASVFLYAGLDPARASPGSSDGTEKTVTIIDAFEAVGRLRRGLISREDVDAIERAICPGEGACGGMYTANTMASVGRGARDVAARRRPRRPPPTAAATASPAASGEAVVELLRRGITARDIMTKEAFENAIAVVMALRRLDQRRAAPARHRRTRPRSTLTLDDFNRIGDRGAAPGRRQAVRPRTS